jgi:uncharacterized protein
MAHFDASTFTALSATYLFVITLIAGGMNSMAGAGNLLAFPVLIFIGVPPIAANATTSVGLWPGSIAGIGGYRNVLPHRPRLLAALIVSSLVGGAVGALVLLVTSPKTFMGMVPYLFLGATLLFIYERRIGRSPCAGESSPRRLTWGQLVAAASGQFFIAVYGGFFGGGVGILMLALLSIVHVGDIHTMNSIRVLLAMVTKSLAVLTFLVAKVIVWPAVLVMVVGAAIGGYGGARLAQKVDPRLVQAFVVIVGLAMTVYFFWRY